MSRPRTAAGLSLLLCLTLCAAAPQGATDKARRPSRRSADDLTYDDVEPYLDAAGLALSLLTLLDGDDRRTPAPRSEYAPGTVTLQTATADVTECPHPDGWPAFARGLREHLGETQREFAERLGGRQPTVAETETGAREPTAMLAALLVLIARTEGYDPARGAEGDE
jgi:DNA-binding XRE family transcriptional regulator